MEHSRKDKTMVSIIPYGEGSTGETSLRSCGERVRDCCADAPGEGGLTLPSVAISFDAGIFVCGYAYIAPSYQTMGEVLILSHTQRHSSMSSKNTSGFTLYIMLSLA